MARRRGGLVPTPARDLEQILRSWAPTLGWVFDGVRSSYPNIGTGGSAYVMTNFAPSQSFEMVALNFTGVTGGTFILTVPGYGTTAPISWSSTSATLLANIDAALEALAGLGVNAIGNTVANMGSGIGTCVVSFSGTSVMGIDFGTMTADGSGLTGTAPTITVAVLNNGGSSFISAPGVGGMMSVRSGYGQYMATPAASLPPAPASSMTFAALVKPYYPIRDGVSGPVSSGSGWLVPTLLSRRPSTATASWQLVLSTGGIPQTIAFDSAGSVSTSSAGSGAAGDIRHDGLWAWVFGTIEDGVGSTARVIQQNGLVASGSAGFTGTWSKVATGQITAMNRGRDLYSLVGDQQAALVWNDRLLTTGEMQTIAAQTPW